MTRAASRRSVLVTGGAGFIGSNIVAALSRRGDRVVVCDRLRSGEKWRNIAKHLVHEVLLPEQLTEWLTIHGRGLTAVVHMGAVSSTAERDADLILRSNLQLSMSLWQFCARHDCTFIYASSAATYGDGAAGFSDQSAPEALARLRPLNPYGWSKHAFDRVVMDGIARGEPSPRQWAGLKFFNVYGPNEYHKGDMRSLIAKSYPRIVAGEPMRLFRSQHADYGDGGQMRDFVYVGDCVDVVMWMLDAQFPSDIYNVGSGKARSWLDLARALLQAAGQPERIEFIDMPAVLAAHYQYFTEAPMAKLRAAGFGRNGTPLEEGIGRYVRDHLSTRDPFV